MNQLMPGVSNYFQPAHNKKRRVAQVMLEVKSNNTSNVISKYSAYYIIANTIPFIAFLDLFLSF